MLYVEPEMEIVEFDKTVLTDGITVSPGSAGEGGGDTMDGASVLGS